MKILLQEGLMLTHYFTLTKPDYHFAILVAVTYWVRIKTVLMSDRALICKAEPRKESFALHNYLGLECISLLCLFKLLMCTWLKPWQPNSGRGAHYSYVFREQQAGKEKKKCWEQQHRVFRQLTNPDTHPSKSLILKVKYFYYLTPYFINYY